jgi:hypothetical protein
MNTILNDFFIISYSGSATAVSLGKVAFFGGQEQ